MHGMKKRLAVNLSFTFIYTLFRAKQATRVFINMSHENFYIGQVCVRRAQSTNCSKSLI